MPRLPDRQITAANEKIKKLNVDIEGRRAVIKSAEAQYDKFDKLAKAAATQQQKLEPQVDKAELAVKKAKASGDKKALAAAQKEYDTLSKQMDKVIKEALHYQKLRGLAEEAPIKAEATLKTLLAELKKTQAELADAIKSKPEYDKKMDAAIQLRNDFLKYIANQLKAAQALAKLMGPQPQPGDDRPGKLEKEVAAQMKPIREPAKMGLEPTDMATELVPLTNQCFKLNKEFLSVIGPLVKAVGK
jgi:chromosome segregation ATPase